MTSLGRTTPSELPNLRTLSSTIATSARYYNCNNTEKRRQLLNAQTIRGWFLNCMDFPAPKAATSRTQELPPCSRKLLAGGQTSRRTNIGSPPGRGVAVQEIVNQAAIWSRAFRRLRSIRPPGRTSLHKNADCLQPTRSEQLRLLWTDRFRVGIGGF